MHASVTANYAEAGSFSCIQHAGCAYLLSHPVAAPIRDYAIYAYTFLLHAQCGLGEAKGTDYHDLKCWLLHTVCPRL
jgi:hypothetical protein